METGLIIKSIMGLIAILAVLIFLLFLEPYKGSKNKKTASVIKKPTSNSKTKTQSTTPNRDLESLVKIIKNKRASADEIGDALDLIIKYHGIVHKKLGIRSHPDFDIYMEILFTICRHPNATKDLIIKFDKEFERLNPEYKQDINDAITKGLNSRRV